MGITELNNNLSEQLKEISARGYEPITNRGRPYLHVINNELLEKIRDLPGGEELLSGYEREAHRRHCTWAA